MKSGTALQKSLAWLATALSVFALLAMLLVACVLPYITVWFSELRWISLVIALNVRRLLLLSSNKHPLATSILLHPVSCAFLSLPSDRLSFIRVKQKEKSMEKPCY